MQVLKTKLTDRQQAVYDYIVRFSEEKGYPPSVAEIAKAFGFRSQNSVQNYKKILMRKGWLTMEERRVRTIVARPPEKVPLYTKEQIAHEEQVLDRRLNACHKEEKKQFEGVGTAYLPDREFNKLKRKLIQKIKLFPDLNIKEEVDKSDE